MDSPGEAVSLEEMFPSAPFISAENAELILDGDNMNAESVTKITCRKCSSVLRAKPEMAGKRAKCPKCGTTVEIPSPVPVEPKKNSPPATQRQKEYARSLDINFAANVTRSEISSLIDAAVAKQDEERYSRLDELERREGEAYEQMRQEVLADIDADDCRLSIAEPSQIVEALSERGFASLLITMPWDEVDDFEDLRDVSFQISYSEDMTRDDVHATIIGYAGTIMDEKGLL